MNRQKLKADNIDTLEIEYGNPVTEKLVFVRENGKRWKMTEPKPSRVESSAVDGIVSAFLSARTEANADLTTNLALHGLDKPTVIVTLKRGTDLSETISLGNLTIGSDKGVVYVTTSDKPDVPQAISRSSLRALWKTIDPKNPPKNSDALAYVRTMPDFRTLKLLNIDMPQGFEEAQQISKIEGKNELVLSKIGSDWLIEKPAGMGNADPDGGPPTVDQSITGVRPLVSNISSYRATDPADFVEDTKDLAKYGLDSANPTLLKISITRKALAGDAPASTEVLLIGKNVDDAGAKVYAMLQGDSVIAKVTGGPSVKSLRNLVAEPKLIRDRNLLRVTMTNVDALQLTAGSDTIDLFKVGAPAQWTMFDSAEAVQSVNQSIVEALTTALAEPRKITNFPAAGQTDAALGFDKPQGELKLWTDGIVKEEPKKEEPKDPTKKEEPKKDEKPVVKKPKLKGEPNVKLIFGKTEGDFIYVRRVVGSATTDAMVPESLFTLVKRKRVEYLDPKLPTFVTTLVTKVSIDRKAGDGVKAVNTVIERASKDDKPAIQATWNILAPDAAKGRNADPIKVNTILANLSGLRPVKLIADKPSPDALASWGLATDAPLLKAVVEFKEPVDGAKERTFLFGKTTEDGQAVYAKIAGTDLVFTVTKKFFIDSMVDPDMMDMVVFRIDKTKVKKLKLSGWADIVGSVQVREVEKKGEFWSFVGPVGYELDPRKVETFLEEILSPRAEKFVTFKTGPTPDQGFDLTKGAMEIEVTVDGVEKPITLMLGKADTVKIERGTDTNPLPLSVYYGQTNQLPGDVFVLLQDRFKSVRSIPAVFRKE